ncbi:MAG: hypothetical protein P1S59_12780 [bacterium]|nr:hypothetical protein [bacterium]
MKRLSVILIAVAFVAITAAGAMGALVDTSHNVVAHDGLTGAAAQQGACSFCHVPHGAAGAGLFPSGLGAVSGGGSPWEGDAIAVMCWDCHGAVTYEDTQQVVPFQGTLNGAHGRDATLLVATGGWGDITGADPDPALAGIYGYDAATDRIGCQSCHNPHDNATRPFFRDNAVGTFVEGDLLTLCEDCHINRADMDVTGDTLGTSTRQNHPTDNRLLADVAGASNLYEFAGAAFSVRFNSTYPDLAVQITSSVAGNDLAHWNLGGKFEANAGAGVTGEVNCGTCHMVHSNETDEAAYAVGDGLNGNAVAAVPAGWGFNFLAVLNTDPAAGAAAAICTGCHDITTDTNAGPGSVTTFSHPYQSTEPWGMTIDTGVTGAYGAKFTGAFGTDATLVCQSCHDMHFARLNDQADADDYSLMRVYCNDCHSTASAKTNHHPSGIEVTYGTHLRGGGGAAGEPQISTAVAWNTVTRDDVQSGATADWTGGGTYYRFGPAATLNGVMNCTTCHFGTAHNNVVAFPGIVGLNAEAEMCVDCHGLNPSQFVDGVRQTDRDGDLVSETGTHYLGPVTNTAWQWGGNVTKDSVVPLAGAASMDYGQDSGVDGDLICTSCHLILTDTFTVQTADNVTDNEPSTVDAVGLLLTPSGNNRTDAAAAGNDFLCSACHGAAPGTGTTHPVQPTYTTDVSAEIWGNASVADNGVTVVGDNTAGTAAGKQINCESCHRAHNSAQSWNNLYTTSHYILEQGARVDASSFINEQVLCNACHSK